MSLKNDSGFTLTEVLVSIVILMVALLGTFQAINLALDRNVENQLRQQAAAVAEQQLNDIKARPFKCISTGVVKSSSIKVPCGMTFKNISVQSMATDLSAAQDTKRISVRVWWNFRGRSYQHDVGTAIGTSALGSGR